jgi:hypothetical protein
MNTTPKKPSKSTNHTLTIKKSENNTTLTFKIWCPNTEDMVSNVRRFMFGYCMPSIDLPFEDLKSISLNGTAVIILTYNIKPKIELYMNLRQYFGETFKIRG